MVLHVELFTNLSGSMISVYNMTSYDYKIYTSIVHMIMYNLEHLLFLMLIVLFFHEE